MEGCIEWTGAANQYGYGRRQWKGRVVYVHRLAYEQAHGPIPPGLFVLHRCDNPPCYNPDHLFLGTQRDNLQDMSRKGRSIHRCGHDEWYVRKDGRRDCAVCARERDRRRRPALIRPGVGGRPRGRA